MSILASILGQTATTSQSDSWLTRAIGGRTRSGLAVSESSALTIPAVFAAIGITSDPIAMLPVVVLERTKDGGRRVAEDHPAHRMLSVAPNPHASSPVLRNAMQGHASAWGNAYAEIVRNGRGQAVELRLALPDRTRPEIVDDRLEYVTSSAGREVRLPAQDTVHIAGMGFDGIRGYSPIALCREALGLAKVTEEFGAAWFGAGSKSGGIIKMPKVISKEAEDRMKKAWSEDNAGIDNAHKARILYEGAEYSPLSIPPEDAQFLQTREFQIAEIARIFRVPLHMLQSHAKSTSWGSGIEQMNIGFVLYTLMPWTTRWEMELNRKLFIGEEAGRYYVKFNLNALLRGDAASRSKYYQTMVTMGAMTRNEVRALEDMDPLDGLDTPLIPASNARLPEEST